MMNKASRNETRFHVREKILMIFKIKCGKFSHVRTACGLPWWVRGKESACQAETWILSLGQEDPLEEEMQLTPVFLLGESHGQRSLAGYSPWSRTELDITKRLSSTQHNYSFGLPRQC